MEIKLNQRVLQGKLCEIVIDFTVFFLFDQSTVIIFYLNRY